MCSDDQHQQVLDALHFIGKRLTVRPFIDTNYWVSDSQGFTLDYKDRRHLYLFCETALTFVIPSLGNYATAAGQWVGFEFREGLKIFTTGQTNPVQVVVRASDEIPLEGTQPISGTITANQGTSPWVTSVSNVNANGQATMANSSPVVLASDQSTLPINLAQWNGAAVSTANPVLTEDQVRALILAGQGFSANTGLISSATNTNIYGGLGLLASAIAKNVLIYRWEIALVQTFGDAQVTVGTALDANLTAAITPLNSNLASATAALLSVFSSAAGFTGPNATPATRRQQYGSAANPAVPIQLVQGQGDAIYIPSGSTKSITAWVKAPAVGNTFLSNVWWVEF